MLHFLEDLLEIDNAFILEPEIFLEFELELGLGVEHRAFISIVLLLRLLV